MQKLRRVLAPVAAIFTLSACAATQTATPLTDGNNVALGQQAYVDGQIVQPIEVLEDSRCPVDARCIWPGRVRVKMLWIRSTGAHHPFEVKSGESTQLADGAFRLESVRPDKQVDAPIALTDYRFSFRFDGGI